jgi:hypothetical protein
LTLGVATAAVGSLVAAVNCASQTTRDGFDGGSGVATGSGGGGSVSSSGSSSGPGSGGTVSIARNDAGAVMGPDGGACAATVSAAKIVPVVLVFMFDRSGSMSDSIGNGQTKWTALVPGLEAFFADPKSKGISASLQFFMQTDECNVAAYATPLVGITPLPSNVFAQAIDAITPTGETPTQPALQGALQYAAQEVSQNPGARVAVVLVTDGEPNGCNSSVPNVASTAASSAPGIPTYVIGIGKPTDLTRLTTIAEAGATNQPFFVQADAGGDDGGCGDAGCAAEAMEQEFENALAVIRGATISCDLQLPAAPANQSLDFGKVNVQYTGSGGSTNTLLYNQSCGGNGLGWAYDDPMMPSRIQICPASCTTIQGDTLGATLDIALGCATQTAQ